MRIGRLSAAALLLVAVWWTPQIERFGALWQYLQAMLAYAVPSIVALFLGGLLWRCPRSPAGPARCGRAAGSQPGRVRRKA